MSLCDAHWFSKTLSKHVGMYVILPEVGEPPFPTMYLLHGLSDDYTIWQRRTRIELYLGNLPMIVVLPDGFRGFYTNNDQGPAYATYMGEELPAYVERFFPARKDRAGRCISGLSMGGYGAFRLALGYPDRYISATSHSGALCAGQKDFTTTADQAEFNRIFGPSPETSAHNLLNLARAAKKAGALPKLRFDCGTSDFLLNDNRKFHAQLGELDVAHEYQEFEGGHEWGYWDLHIQESLRFHARHMGIGGNAQA